METNTITIDSFCDYKKLRDFINSLPPSTIRRELDKIEFDIKWVNRTEYRLNQLRAAREYKLKQLGY